MRRTVARAISNAQDVLAASDAIMASATERTKLQLVRTLLDDEVLDALHDFPPSEETASALRMHLRWLNEQLGLEPFYEKGATLTVPVARLTSFDVRGGTTPEGRGVCTVSVVASGWKRGGTVIRKPVVSLGQNADSTGAK